LKRHDLIFFVFFLSFLEGDFLPSQSRHFFYFKIFFSEMRSWLMDFFAPSITVWACSITGFTLVLTRRVSVFGPFCLPKVVQNPPVLPAPRRAAACLPAALPLKPCRLPAACRAAPHGLPPAVIPAACLPFCLPCLPFHGLPCLLPAHGLPAAAIACRAAHNGPQSAHKKALGLGMA